MYNNPRIPHGLIAAGPFGVPGPLVNRIRVRIVLEGDMHSGMKTLAGCLFHTRRANPRDICHSAVQVEKQLEGRYMASIHLLDEILC